MIKYYLDTCIWVDYYENKSDRFRPLGDWALELLNKILQNKDLILYSDMIVEELKNLYKNDEIEKIFKIIKDENLLIKVNINNLQAKEAATLCKSRSISFGDALHAILARDNGAILVTRDNHFLELTDIADIKKPEELL